jgi:hypothetical protein
MFRCYSMKNSTVCELEQLNLHRLNGFESIYWISIMLKQILSDCIRLKKRSWSHSYIVMILEHTERDTNLF